MMKLKTPLSHFLVYTQLSFADYSVLFEEKIKKMEDMVFKCLIISTKSLSFDQEN
jgi:hypothetical protein